VPVGLARLDAPYFGAGQTGRPGSVTSTLQSEPPAVMNSVWSKKMIDADVLIAKILLPWIFLPLNSFEVDRG